MSNKYVSPEKILEYVLKALDKKARAAQRPSPATNRRFSNTTQLNQWEPRDGTFAWVGSVGYVRIVGSWAIFYEDTGWVSCPIIPGRTVQGGQLPSVRRHNGKVQMQWGISGAGMAVNSAYDSCTIPSGFRPSQFKYFMGAAQSANAAVRVSVSPAGLLTVATGPAVPSYVMFDVGGWYTD